jgi:hypothetical protein
MFVGMEITRIEIPNYIRQVQLSASRMPKFYEMVKGKLKGKALPLKYQTPDYKFRVVMKGKKAKTLLCDKHGQPVVSNPQSQGTPRLYTINGQDLYNSNIHTHTRNKIVTAIKKSLQPYLLRMPAIKLEDYPLIIKMEVHDLIKDPLLKNQDWDLDNRAQGWYVKCFQDLLKSEGKIIEDSIQYITGPPAPVFIPVEKAEDRKLVFIICSDTREIIINNDYYKHFKTT